MISEKVGLVVDQVRMAIRVLDGAKKLKKRAGEGGDWKIRGSYKIYFTDTSV